MLEFRSDDPFPLVVDCSYEEQKSHAAQVDDWLGIQTETIENQLKRRLSLSGSPHTDDVAPREFWVGKSVQTFSTPYTELREIVEILAPQQGQMVFDLGAGYGRLAHVLARHFPEVWFKGYELVPERQREAQRAIDFAKLEKAQVILGDASTLDFTRDPADFYFMYDFGSRRDVEMCVENLKNAARNKSTVVVARGGRSRDIIEKSHAWLAQVVRPVHRDHYSIYRSS